jgi:hypothetical protein
MLYNDRRICDKRPKVIGSKAWIALEMVKEGFRIGVVVWIYMNRSMSDVVSAQGRYTAVHTGWMFDP